MPAFSASCTQEASSPAEPILAFPYLALQVYALQVADTVVVAESGKVPEVATNTCPKNWEKISYTLNVGPGCVAGWAS